MPVGKAAHTCSAVSDGTVVPDVPPASATATPASSPGSADAARRLRGRKRFTGQVDQPSKGGLVADGQVGQHFAVDFYVSRFQAGDEAGCS